MSEQALENLARLTALRFGNLAFHATEGGWCVHVFRNHDVGCRATTILEGLEHVNAEHTPGELEPNHNGDRP
jgi:hypothetical protein